MRSEFIADLALPVDIFPVREFSDEPVSELQRIVSFDDSFTTMSTVQNNNDVVLTNVASGREIRRLPLNARFQAKLSPDGKFIAADKTGTNEFFFCRATGKGPITSTGVKRRNRNFDFSPDSKLLHVADNKDVHSFDLETGDKIRSLPLFDNSIWLSTNRAGTRIAATNSAGELIIIDSTTGKNILQTKVGGGALSAGDFSPDGKHIAVAGGFRGNILIFDVATGRQVMEFTTKAEFTDQARYDSSGKYLVGGDWNRTARVWDLESGELVLNVPAQLIGLSTTNHRLALRQEANVEISELQPSQLFWHARGHEMGRHRVLFVSFHAKLPLAISGGEDGVRIVNTDTRTELAFLPIGEVRTALFHPVDGSIVTWGDSGLLRWPFTPTSEGNWEIGPFEELPDPEGRWPDELAFSRNGKSLAGAFYHSGGFAIDWSSRSGVQQLGPHAGSSRVSVSPDGKYVATGNWKGRTVCIWEVETGNLHRKFHSDNGGWAFPTFSSCGQLLAIATPAATTLYDVATFEPLGEVPPTKCTPAFSPDGRTIVIESITGARSTELYDVASQQFLAKLAETPERMGSHSSFKYGPRGRFLAKPCGVQGISFWDMDQIRTELSALEVDWGEQVPDGESTSAPASETTGKAQAETVTSIDYRLYAREEAVGEEFPIDLEPHANRRIDESLNDEKAGYSYEPMPRGWVDLEGVHFQIGDDILVLGSDQATAPDLPLGEEVVKIHFLHSMLPNRDARASQKLAQYVVRYEDESTEVIPLNAKQNISDCRANHKFARLSKGKIAWMGETNQRELVSAVRTTWINPHPEKKIASVKIELADDAGCSVVCLAITGER